MRIELTRRQAEALLGWLDTEEHWQNGDPEDIGAIQDIRDKMRKKLHTTQE